MKQVKRLNSKGVAHHMVIAILAISLVGAFGAYRVFFSKAATAPVKGTRAQVVYSLLASGKDPKRAYDYKKTYLGQYNNRILNVSGSWKLCDDRSPVRGGDKCARLTEGRTYLLCEFRFKKEKLSDSTTLESMRIKSGEQETKRLCDFSDLFVTKL